MTRDRLEELVRAHQAEIYRYVRYLGADPVSAADLVQDTFVAAFRSEDPPDLSDLRARTVWLREIVRLRFLMFCRRQRSSPVAVSNEWLEETEATWSSESLREGDGFDYLQALEKCVESLPAREREQGESLTSHDGPITADAWAERDEALIVSRLRRGDHTDPDER